MAYKDREKHRRQTAIQQNRRNATKETQNSYWLIDARYDCRCLGCGGVLRKGRQMIFRKNGQITLCLFCADKDPLIDYRPAVGWEENRKRKIAKPIYSTPIKDPDVLSQEDHERLIRQMQEHLDSIEVGATFTPGDLARWVGAESKKVRSRMKFLDGVRRVGKREWQKR